MAYDRPITIRLQEETYEQLVQDAQELGLPPAVMARVYLVEALRGNTTIFDMAQKLPEDPPVEQQAPSPRRVR